MANLSYLEIIHTCLLVSCEYKRAGDSQLFVEHYVGPEREYFALFSNTPDSYLPITITSNEIS